MFMVEGQEVCQLKRDRLPSDDLWLANLRANYPK